MIILMKKNVTQEQIDHVTEWISSVGYKPHISQGVERTLIGAIGDDRGKVHLKAAAFLPGVEKVVPILKPYKLAGREFRGENTIVRIGEVQVGGGEFIVMAGPCSVESEEQLVSTARAVKASGAKILRGGAFKPRTSPYSFRGLEAEGLRLLALARQETGLPVVTEIMDPRQLDLICGYADILQLGSRNMQNYSLLEEVGRCRKPVLLIGILLTGLVQGRGRPGDRNGGPEDVDADSAFREMAARMARYFGWLLSFVALIWAIGISLAIPIYILAYMKIEGRYAWRSCVLYASVTAGLITVVYGYLFRVAWPEGALLRSLGL